MEASSNLNESEEDTSEITQFDHTWLSRLRTLFNGLGINAVFVQESRKRHSRKREIFVRYQTI